MDKIVFKDECIDGKTVVLECRYIKEMIVQDNYIFIFNLDGLFFQTKKIKFRFDKK